MKTITNRRRRFFDCVSGTNGDDYEFAIVSKTTGCSVAWAGYWDYRVPCGRVARGLTVALNAALSGRRIFFCIASLAKEQRQIAIVWNTDDVRTVRPDLSEDQAWQVLLRVENEHDGDHGVTWDTLRDVAEQLFACATLDKA